MLPFLFILLLPTSAHVLLHSNYAQRGSKQRLRKGQPEEEENRDEMALWGDIGALPPIDIYPEGRIPGHELPFALGKHESHHRGDPNNIIHLLCGGKGNDPGTFYDDVSVPQLIPIPVPLNATRRTDAAVLSLPGGGHDHLSVGKATKRSGLATFLNKGISVFVLKYRVPGRSWLEQDAVCQMDLQRAVSLLRAEHARWGISPDRIGILGVSAGAETVITLLSDKVRRYERIDHVDDFGFHINWAFFMYPGIPLRGKLREPNTTTWPPLLITAGLHDPCVPVEQVFRFFNALRLGGAKDLEIYVYPEGKHGFEACEYDEQFQKDGTGFCMPVVHFENFLNRSVPISVDPPLYPANYSSYVNFKNPNWCPPSMKELDSSLMDKFCSNNPWRCSGHCGSECLAKCSSL